MFNQSSSWKTNSTSKELQFVNRSSSPTVVTIEDLVTRPLSYVMKSSEMKSAIHVDKIKIDGKLQFSCNIEHVEYMMKDHVKYYCDLDEKLRCNKPVYPSDYALARMSSMSYNGINDRKDGWALLTQASNSDKAHGYNGYAYFSAEHQQIVIVHSCTKSLKAAWTDLTGSVLSKFVFHINSAITFTEKILNVITRFNGNNTYLKLSITGHSLGGWLAQLTTFTAKYLTVDEDRNNRLRLIKETEIGYHAHTVVFDSPGCKKMLEQLKSEYLKCYDDVNRIQISIDSLDITTYLSVPNQMNCCAAHVGQLYRIFVDLSTETCVNNGSNSWGVTNIVNRVRRGVKQSKSNINQFLYTVDAHGINKIANCFDQQTGLVKRNIQGNIEVHEVLNWPIIEGTVSGSSECRKFFDSASTFNSESPTDTTVNLPPNINCEIRYQTKHFDVNKINWNVFNETELHFLRSFDDRRFIETFGSVVFLLDTNEKKIALQSAIQALDSMQFRIDRNRRVPLLGENIKPADFISYVKQFNHFFPYLKREKGCRKGIAEFGIKGK